MRQARVVGTVVSTIQHPSLEGSKLLLCDYLDPKGRPTGAYDIAVDTVNAGPGDHVLVLDEGNGARQILRDPDAPVRAVIAAVVDQVDIS